MFKDIIMNSIIRCILGRNSFFTCKNSLLTQENLPDILAALKEI